ncbi:MAG TPA: alpha/beta hydrolase, partial [Planctomycetia bacterium]|nr:alpha/beta hydrolase [Planctomycetia bacterium]
MTALTEQKVLRSPDEMFLFFPAKYPEGDWKPLGLDFEDLSFKADDGVSLHGWHCPAPSPRAFVLFCHGNGANLTVYAPVMRRFQQEMGITSLFFDYRGYGRSEGVRSVAGVLRDARAART